MSEGKLIRSSIKTSLMKFVLFRGSIIAGLGALLLLIGMLIPAPYLAFWGFPLFLFSVGLVTWGLLPYKRLRYLELNPYQILITPRNSWIYFSKGKPVFELPLVEIERISFFERERVYGVGVILTPSSKKITLHQKNFNLEKFKEKSSKMFNCDLFFPYFSERACRELIEYQQDFQSPD